MAASRSRAILWLALVATALFAAWTEIWPAHSNQILRWFHDFPRRTAFYRGHYSTGFEESAFHPCGSAEVWWVDVDEKAEPQWSRAMAAHDRLSYVEWRGVRTGKGRYGHLGQYSRDLRVVDVTRVRQPRPDDCE
jgi:hypothetical protein